MALAHTILAVLSEAPHSGYDISKQFEDTVGCYWQASQQQIYRELGKMERQGWVTYELVPQDGKPDKKIYAIAPPGSAELARWFAEPAEPTAIREDLLVKVIAAPHVAQGIVGLEAELRRRRAVHLDQLARYQHIEAQYRSQPAPSQVAQFYYLTLRRGMRYEQDWIAWCDEVLACLQNQSPTSPQSRPSAP